MKTTASPEERGDLPRPPANGRRAFLRAVLAAVAVCSGIGSVVLGTCGPFTDVAADSFCPFVLEVFTLGVTTGTTPTTYDPTSSVSRLQMAAFLSRGVDAVLKRGGRRAVLNHFYTPQVTAAIQVTTVGTLPQFVRCDGQDLWVTNYTSNSVSRVRGSDGRLLETWTGATGANNLIAAAGRVFVNNLGDPGVLYQIDPRQFPGAVVILSTAAGNGPRGMAFDGSRVWIANYGGAVTMASISNATPWTVTTVTAGFSSVVGAVFDGSNVWVTDYNAGTLLKLDGAGAILQTVSLGGGPNYPAFDGTNIWVPNNPPAAISFLSVVRASNGTVLATLTGNGLNTAEEAAFDGQRVLVTNNASGQVSLWKAADLTPLGSFSVGGPGTSPFGTCSDGADFWIVLSNIANGRLARF